MKITVLQTDIAWGDPANNIAQAGELIAKAQQSDLYVLPEMWASGFNTANPACTDAPLEWMASTAKLHRCAICGSLTAKAEDDSYRNRMYFTHPDGSIDFYDKRHLFAHGGEDKTFSKGSARVVAKYKGARFLLQTCYDLRFPVWMRNRDDYDAIIISANWPASRQGVWQILLRARAIENQCYVIGANRVGRDATCLYIGRSAIIDAKGRTLAQAKGDAAQTVTADIDMEALGGFRKKVPVLKDKDLYELE